MIDIREIKYRLKEENFLKNSYTLNSKYKDETLCIGNDSLK
jgi:hypothetical protein